MTTSRTIYVAIYVEVPDHVERLGTHASLDEAKERVNEHYRRHHAGAPSWHDEPRFGSRARHQNAEYLIRELEWVDHEA